MDTLIDLEKAQTTATTVTRVLAAISNQSVLEICFVKVVYLPIEVFTITAMKELLILTQLRVPAAKYSHYSSRCESRWD